MASAYSWLLLAGIVVTLIFWSRLAKRDSRLMIIYLAALAGAFVGAKIVYLAAEGWMFWSSPDRWLIWATGKTILGALLGGYAAVEIAKSFLGYSQATGDWFALVAPIGIILGRIGCLLHGCCLGTACEPAWWTLRDSSGLERWPAVPLEMGFNALAMLAFLILRKRRLLTGQHFHLYLMGYGAFRFAHEFVRGTPRVSHEFTGYQVAALAVFLLGLAGFVPAPRCCHKRRTRPPHEAEGGFARDLVETWGGVPAFLITRLSRGFRRVLARKRPGRPEGRRQRDGLPPGRGDSS